MAKAYVIVNYNDRYATYIEGVCLHKTRADNVVATFDKADLKIEEFHIDMMPFDTGDNHILDI